MRAKITKRVVDGAEARDATYLIRDTDVKGFVLVVTPAGAKSYAVDYRAGSGRGSPKRRLTIGKHGSPWTPETARIEAKRLLAEVAAGRDPATARQEDRKALTFGELIDLYLSEGASHKKASTLKADRGRIEHHLRPLLGKLRADRIVRADVERMRNAVTAGKTARRLRAARSVGRAASQPAAKAPPRNASRSSAQSSRSQSSAACAPTTRREASRRRRCARSSASCPRRKSPSWPRLSTLKQRRSGNPYPSAAIKLLLLTGCRRGEIVNLCWDHVDFERECLRLPDSKTGAKIVYLNAPARALLQQLPRMADNPRVIPGTRADSASAAIDKAWASARAAAGLADVRLHDLRHSFASVGAAGGLSLPIIGALLGHKHTDDDSALRSSVGRSAPRRQRRGRREDCRRDEPRDEKLTRNQDFRCIGGAMDDGCASNSIRPECANSGPNCVAGPLGCS